MAKGSLSRISIEHQPTPNQSIEATSLLISKSTILNLLHIRPSGNAQTGTNVSTASEVRLSARRSVHA